jgi:phosphate:Na+ symporter
LAGPRADPPDEAIAEFERCTTQLREMLRIHRSATLGAVANGTLTADSALLRVEAVRNLEALSQHAWRSAIHLIGRG